MNQPPEMRYVIYEEEGILHIKRCQYVADLIMSLPGLEILKSPFRESDEDE